MELEKIVAKVLLEMKKARLEQAGQYTMNRDMHIECNLLKVEIEALNKIIGL